MLTGGPLAIKYFISVGCGVRLFVLRCVCRERPGEHTKTAPHLCCITFCMGLAEQITFIPKMLALNKFKTDIEYPHPEISVTNISISRNILAGSDDMLENPEEGDDWNW